MLFAHIPVLHSVSCVVIQLFHLSIHLVLFLLFHVILSFLLPVYPFLSSSFLCSYFAIPPSSTFYLLLPVYLFIVILLSSSYFFPFTSCLLIHCYSSFIYSALSPSCSFIAIPLFSSCSFSTLCIKGTILHGLHSSSTCGVFDRKETTPCNVFLYCLL